MVGTSAIQNLIRENKTFRITSSIQTGKREGMQLMDDHLFQLWENDKCELHEVLYRSLDQKALALRINAHTDQGLGPELDHSEDEVEALENA